MMDFFNGKKIFITGHTGFKGTWLCRMLILAGAEITGYSLEPPTDINLFDISDIEKSINHITGDIRDLDKLMNAMNSFEPEIVIHLAAQPLVRESYKNPVYTYETNVMGTVNICEAVRRCPSVKSFLNVTTDKVYKNYEWDRGYCETDFLDGYDPYSNSKSCSELVTHSYINSFYGESISVSTARAGNVIGGGDFAVDRIVPDCFRAAKDNINIEVRNPFSVRPYQHVLEPLYAYLMITKMQYENRAYAGFYNVGPDDLDCINTGDLVSIFCKYWNEDGSSLEWVDKSEKDAPHEANFLKLDCSKLKKVFGWNPVWNIETAIEKTVEWYKVYNSNGNICACMDMQIKQFLDNHGGECI